MMEKLPELVQKNRTAYTFFNLVWMASVLGIVGVAGFHIFDLLDAYSDFSTDSSAALDTMLSDPQRVRTLLIFTSLVGAGCISADLTDRKH